MSKKNNHTLGKGPFHSTKEELTELTKLEKKDLHKRIPRYRLAYTDEEFLLRKELRAVRFQLELLRPELVLSDNDIDKTIVFFGSARLPAYEVAKQQFDAADKALQKKPDDLECQRLRERARNTLHNSKYMAEATRLAEIASADDKANFTVITGGGPGVMEAANKGAHNVGKRSVALNVSLPNEQVPNPYVTPELTFQFHYFAIRKMHLLMRSRALAAFPGGYGTLDELFEVLTLIQTGKIDPIPLLLFNERFWRHIVNFEGLAQEGTISERDLELFCYVETADEAWQKICEFYDL